MVDRGDRAPVVAATPVATLFHAASLDAGASIVLGEAVAHHARVKRLEIGDRVRVVNGAGRRAMGVIAALRRLDMDVSLEQCVDVPRPAAIHLRVPVGDRERMLWLAEKTAELGAASWQAVHFARSASVSPRGEGESFVAKVRARMISALEQSGGAWLPELLPDVAADRVALDANQRGILLAVDGAPLPALTRDAREPVILFGPEGGMTAAERGRFTAGRWSPASLAATTLRFETAGIAALAVLRAASLSRG
jgi:16S rRNA (uracil1498-N3)-methyltransferase